QEHLKQGMGLLLNDPRILEVDYWSYAPWDNSRFPLVSSDGNLTLSGQTYLNPLTDVPNGGTTIGLQNGGAKLQWTNTTRAWAAEAEFWVRPSGASTWVYKNTQLVTGPGGVETPSVSFNAGDSVKGRVRYYNRFGSAD